MNTISVVLQTSTPEFANDLCDVIKLFFVVNRFSTETGDTDGELLIHTLREENGIGTCTVSFRNRQTVLQADIPQTEDGEHAEVQRKRLRKRLCKLTLYTCLKQLTGYAPPWGSLTGIRPTRLFYEQLNQSQTMAQAEAHMTQLYDVSYEKAALLRRIVHQQQSLPQADENDVDVYVSIPFCRTRCAYCSFPGEAVGKGKMLPPYLDALKSEMQLGKTLMENSGMKLRALYVGGGTPSALNEEQFESLIEYTVRLFPNACEYTVEAGRPDTITRRKLQILLNHGIDRISINPQTMNDETLCRIGRDHTAQQTVEAFETARAMGFRNINMDVIAGLPGEDETAFAHTMSEILRLCPDSLTVHTLAIKHSSRLNLEKWPLPDGTAASAMVAMGEETAAVLGMEPYYLYRQKYMAGQQQNVGYAVPGKACLYNVDIMEENMSILAFGAGAISKRVEPDRELRIVRAPNVSNVAQYINRVQEMAQRKQNLFL